MEAFVKNNYALTKTAIFYAILALIALWMTAPAHAANWKGQCITAKGKPAPTLVSPDGKPVGGTLSYAPFMVAEDNGKYVHLTTVPDYNQPDPEANAGKDAGWVAKKEMIAQDLRNCN